MTYFHHVCYTDIIHQLINHHLTALSCSTIVNGPLECRIKSVHHKARLLLLPCFHNNESTRILEICVPKYKRKCCIIFGLMRRMKKLHFPICAFTKHLIRIKYKHYTDAAWTVDTDHVWFMDSCCLILTHHLRSSRNHQTRLQFSL